jgi:hypothetical protein
MYHFLAAIPLVYISVGNWPIRRGGRVFSFILPDKLTEHVLIYSNNLGNSYRGINEPIGSWVCLGGHDDMRARLGI